MATFDPSIYLDIVSPQDLQTVMVDIRRYGAWYGSTAAKQRRSIVQNTPPPTIQPASLKLLQTVNAAEPLNEQRIDDLIADLEDWRDTAPTLTITLAAPASSRLKADIVSWCRKNLSPSSLVTFKFNSLLLGGMVVRVGSRIFDWSWRRGILAERNKFPEVLKRV